MASSSKPTNNSSKALSGKYKASVNSIYSLRDSNWSKSFPYGFRFTNREGEVFKFFLPISPSDISVSTNFATNIIPTLYGTVEEHSSVRYYDMTINGTTGMAPKYTDVIIGNPDKQTQKSYTSPGRQSFSAGSSVAAGGLFAKSKGVLDKLINKTKSILDGNQQSTSMGFSHKQSGYTAFHNLYRFLLLYKKDANKISIKSRETHPLVFMNYKDNIEYFAAISNFSLRRSADNPMLYNYSIQMRCYEMKSIDLKKDPFSSSNRLKDLGLDGVRSSSELGKAKQKAQDTRSIIGAATAGISILGK